MIRSDSLGPGLTPSRRQSAALPLLATKYTIPNLRGSTIPRLRLIDLLEQGAQRRLTLLAAPPGFGKTTLLAAWARHAGGAAAWVSLDAGDNDPVRFWHYVLAALDHCRPGMGDAALALLQAAQIPSIESVLTALLNSAATMPERVVLVLDDLHVITSQPIYEGLAFLIEHMPPQLHLVIASRTVPPLNMARLRANSELVEIRADLLRFSADEVRALLNGLQGLALTDADIAALESRTEGWAAGLRLASLALQGQRDRAAFVASLSGSHRIILDYLMEEVLARQSAERQQFLLDTAILERLAADVCDAVAERHDSQRELEALEQANIFIEPLDDERRWFRYHQLFGEFLREAQSRRDPLRAPALHRRAAAWYVAQGRLADALPHASAAGDTALVVDLVEQMGRELLEQGEVVTIRRWLDLLSLDLVGARPRLGLLYAWLLITSIQLDEAERWLGACEARWAQQGGALDDEHRGELALLWAMLAFAQGDMPRSEDLLREVRAMAPAPSTWVYRRLVWFEGIVFTIQSEFSIVQGALAEAELNSVFSSTPQRQYILVIILIARGQINAALSLLQAISSHFVSDDPGSKIFEMLMYQMATIIFYERNDLDRAYTFAQRINTFSAKHTGSPGALIGPLMLFQVQWAQGDWDAARRTQATIEREIHAFSFFTLVLRDLLVLFVTYLARQGQFEEMRRWITFSSGLRIEVPAGRRSSMGLALSLQGYRINLAQAYHALAEQRYDDALALATPVCAESTADGWGYTTILATLVEAQVWQGRGQHAQAVDVALRALALAAPEGFVRAFVDGGEPVRQLLALVLAALGRQPGHPQAALAPYVRTLLAAFPAAPAAPAALVEPLSARELDVLRLVAIGRSNQQVAQALVIGVGTIKTHLLNIYGKLGVHNRTEAVARARDLGLVD